MVVEYRRHGRYILAKITPARAAADEDCGQRGGDHSPSQKSQNPCARTMVGDAAAKGTLRAHQRGKMCKTANERLRVLPTHLAQALCQALLKIEARPTWVVNHIVLQ